MYVIHKNSSRLRSESYSGPTWDDAGIRGKRQDVYRTREEAEELAKILSQFNQTGFSVDFKTWD